MEIHNDMPVEFIVLFFLVLKKVLTPVDNKRQVTVSESPRVVWEENITLRAVTSWEDDPSFRVSDQPMKEVRENETTALIALQPIAVWRKKLNQRPNFEIFDTNSILQKPKKVWEKGFHLLSPHEPPVDIWNNKFEPSKSNQDMKIWEEAPLEPQPSLHVWNNNIQFKAHVPITNQVNEEGFAPSAPQEPLGSIQVWKNNVELKVNGPIANQVKGEGFAPQEPLGSIQVWNNNVELKVNGPIANHLVQVWDASINPPGPSTSQHSDPQNLDDFIGRMDREFALLKQLESSLQQEDEHKLFQYQLPKNGEQCTQQLGSEKEDGWQEPSEQLIETREDWEQLDCSDQLLVGAEAVDILDFIAQYNIQNYDMDLRWECIKDGLNIFLLL